MVDNIGDNLEDALNNLESVNDNLGAAQKYQKKSKKKIIILAVIICVVVAIAAGIVFFLTKD